MRTSKKDTETRQEQLAEAARHVIAAEGINALSIAGITERVGVVPSAFFRHDNSKDEVLDAILNQLRNKLLGNVAAVREETSESIERLKRLMDRHARLLAENHVIPRLFSPTAFTPVMRKEKTE